LTGLSARYARLVTTPWQELVRAGRAHERASDSDRERAVAELRVHCADGRLSPEDLEARAGVAMRATTLGELDDLRRDLPSLAGRRRFRSFVRFQRWLLRAHATVFVAFNGLLVAIWGLVGGPFWPAFSLVPWGALLGMHYAGYRALRRRAGLPPARQRRLLGP
jgi:Domain of unknown function (DUF1707)